MRLRNEKRFTIFSVEIHFLFSFLRRMQCVSTLTQLWLSVIQMPYRWDPCTIHIKLKISLGYNWDNITYICSLIPVITQWYVNDKVYGIKLVSLWTGYGNGLKLVPIPQCLFRGFRSSDIFIFNWTIKLKFIPGKKITAIIISKTLCSPLLNVSWSK